MAVVDFFVPVKIDVYLYSQTQTRSKWRSRDESISMSVPEIGPIHPCGLSR